MSERNDAVRAALAQVGDTWSSTRTERTLPGVRQRLRRKRTQRGLAVTCAVGAVAAAAALGWFTLKPQTVDRLAQLSRGNSQPAAAAGPRHMQFEDGSLLELLDASTRVIVDEVTTERVTLQLLRGSARVDVVPRKERAFRVRCGEVSVEVLGTAFELVRQAERTRVSVLRGRVAVRWPEGSMQLAAGEAGWFPKSAAESLQPTAAGSAPASLLPPQPAAAASEAPASSRRSHAHAPSRRGSVHEATWQAQAERGEWKRAYDLMEQSQEVVSDDVQELLLAADAARLSGHPAQAVPFLRRVTEQHRRDPRASLAAFTLGGVLLHQLAKPREAEAAYARARSLALSPALAQDALARQVESAQRAGDTVRMRELAREYLRRYPDGRRVQWVRQLSEP